ncbi:MAG: DUF5686 family protein [Fermentimonas sp.]|jgi:hypothetical protein
MKNIIRYIGLLLLAHLCSIFVVRSNVDNVANLADNTTLSQSDSLVIDDINGEDLGLGDNIDLNGFKGFVQKTVKFVTDDWIALGKKESNKFDFGRLQTFPSYNPIEGIRLRGGIASTTRFHPNMFLKGYVAYGFKDHKVKYRGELVYALNDRVYHDGEFPKNNISVVYENDLYSPGELHPRALNDLLLFTYRRSINQAMYRNFAEINWEREYENGFSPTIWLRKSRMVPEGELAFERNTDNGIINDKALHTTAGGVILRYAYREAYEQDRRKRKPLEMTSPVFFIGYSMGRAEVFDETKYYNKLELSAQKRFSLGKYGRVDLIGEAMKVWNQVPFPLLLYPNQRFKHHIENVPFYMLQAMEFVADEQFSVRSILIGDDMFLSRVPLLNKLNAKELLSFKAIIGRLSKSNRENDLYQIPAMSFEYGSMPYMEASVGITSILGMLRIEYVHRITYRDHPDAALGRIRVDVTM